MSLNLLMLDEKKEWLNARVNSLTSDGLVATREEVFIYAGSISAEELLKGIVTVDTTAASVTVTFGTDFASEFIQHLGFLGLSASEGNVYKILFTAHSNETGAVTLSTIVGSGMTLSGTPKVPGNCSRLVYFRIVTIEPPVVHVY